MVLVLALAGMTSPLAAQTIAITGGTVALGDGSEPIVGGTVVIRDGRILGAGVGLPIPRGAEIDRAVANLPTPGYPRR